MIGMHNETPSIHIPDAALKEQKDWKDGEKYVVTLTLKQIGRDTMYKDEMGGGTTRYEIVKAKAHGDEDSYKKLQRKVHDAT